MFKVFYRLLCLIISIGVSTCLYASESPEKADKIILVTGTTGTQGGAVARELLKRQYTVRGFTRNPDSEKAKVLTTLGIEMIKGDFDNPDSLDRAMQNTYGVFSVVDFGEHGYEGEVRHGRNIADAAKRNGVKHLVFSSVAHADEKTGIPHFDSKYEIELYIQSLQIPFTVLRPVSFMDNWEFSRQRILKGVITGPVAADKPHQQIAAIDIARFAAEALDKPEHWLGRSVNIAGQQYMRKEIANIFSRVLGRSVQYKQISWQEFERDNSEHILEMTRWFAKVGYRVDIDALNKELPGMQTLEQYLRINGWQNNH